MMSSDEPMMPDGRVDVTVTIEAGIACVVLGRPPVNAFSEIFTQHLHEALDQIEAHSDVSVLHIKSALDTFSAGADLDLIEALLQTSDGRDHMIEFVRELQRLFVRIETLDAVSIAEIAGPAVGGGLELALACDLRVASRGAKLGLPEAGLGLLPAAGGTQRLPRICGEAVARRLILGGEIIGGDEAHRLGLVHWVFATNELSSRTAELVTRLASIPAAALASGKRCIAAASDQAADGYELELTETRQLYEVAETQERIQSFLGSRA